MFEHFVGQVFVFGSEPEARLPEIDIPALSQSQRAPESLLIQLDAGDLSERSRAKIEPLETQQLLSIETIKQNVGIEPDRQLQLAEELHNNV